MLPAHLLYNYAVRSLFSGHQTLQGLLRSVWDFYGLPHRRQALRFTVKMAEAAETPQHRFFCHCCKSETNPTLPVSRFKRVSFHSTRAAHPCAHEGGGINTLRVLYFLYFFLKKVNWLIFNRLLAYYNHSGCWIADMTGCWWLFICAHSMHPDLTLEREREGGGIKSGDSRCHI